MRISYIISLCAAVLGACNPGVFDELTKGSTGRDAGPDASAPDASDDDGRADEDDGGREPIDPNVDGGIILPPECDGDASICDGPSAQRRCVDGFWSELELCELSCIGDACGGRCKPGERQCDDTQPQRCDDDGAWVDDGNPCMSICDEGVCEGACVPGSAQCVSSTHRQTCDEESGQWDAASACAFACVGQECGGDCVPGARQCVAETPQRSYRTCNTQGVWSEPSLCSYVCVEGGECGGQCVPGTRSCMNNVPHACSADGAWTAEAACSGARPVCVGDGECRCRPGAMRCGGDGTQPQVCNGENQWQDVGAPCARCNAGQCGGEGCTDQRIWECGQFGAACVNGECGGGFSNVGDGCSNGRRSACADAGCGCVDGLCSGGFCDGSGCTAHEHTNCETFGCGCYLRACSGNACD